MAVLFLHAWLVLMIAPVFSEEYSRNVTGVLLSTIFGKSKDIRKKIEAAMGFGIFVYFLLCMLLFGMTVAAYGGDGLWASTGMTVELFLFFGRGDWSIAFYLFLLFLLGLASVLLNVGITLFVSSKCSRPVSAVTAGMLLFFLPYVLNQVLFHILLELGVANNAFGWRLMDAMRIFCFSMPMYLPHPEIFRIPFRWAMYVPVIMFVVMIVCIWRAYKNYREYEGG